MKRILTACVLAFSFSAFAGDAAPAAVPAGTEKPAEAKTAEHAKDAKKKAAKKGEKEAAPATGDMAKPADAK